MRGVVLGASIFLAGCSPTANLADPFVSSVSNFAAGLTGQDTLEVDLLKDFARKSEQLEFISKDTYSCGNPRDKVVIAAIEYYRDFGARYGTKKYAALIKAHKESRAKDDSLKAIASYGETIAGIVKGGKELEDALTKGRALISTGKANLSVTEIGALLGALDQVLNIAQQVQKYGVEIAIREAAMKMHNELFATTKKLASRKSLMAVSETEAVAFDYWDACARERLNFVRDYYPSIYASGKDRDIVLSSHLKGMDKTPVLDFAREYGLYLSEREAFVGRRPDYVALLQAIEKNNEDLIKLKGFDLLDAANNAGTLAGSLPKSTEAIRKSRVI